jgi:hypothetical protein
MPHFARNVLKLGVVLRCLSVVSGLVVLASLAFQGRPVRLHGAAGHGFAKARADHGKAADWTPFSLPTVQAQCEPACSSCGCGCGGCYGCSSGCFGSCFWC